MAILRRIVNRNISLCLFSFALGCLLTYKMVTEEYLTRNDGNNPRPPSSLDVYQQLVVIEELYQFKHDEIRYINRTPGFRYFDDHLISSQNNIYLEKYRLHYCKIDKNMGSTMQAFLCYIDNPQNHSTFFFNGKWGAGLAGSYCSTSTTKGDLRKRFMSGAQNVDFFNEVCPKVLQTELAEDNLLSLTTWKPKGELRLLLAGEYTISGIDHVAILRNPISRFISAFVDVCVEHTYEKQYPTKVKTLCFSCKSNLTCFLTNLHTFLYGISEHLPNDRWHRDWHFFPQSWYCDFDRHMKRYQLIRYNRDEKFYNEIIGLMRKIRVETSLIADIEKQLRTKEAVHATYGEVSSAYEKELLENPLLLEYVYKIYYMDFVWFDYRL